MKTIWKGVGKREEGEAVLPSFGVSESSSG